MTIKKRLFWSNILMLVIPVVLSIAVSYTILFLFSGGSSESMRRAFPKAVEIMLEFRRDGEVDSLLEKSGAFNDAFADSSVFIAIAQDGQFLYPPDALERFPGQSRLLTAVAEGGVTGIVTINDMRIMIEDIRGYQLVLVDSQYNTMQKSYYGRPLISHVLALLAVMLCLIIGTNRILTRILTKRITSSLDVLTHGVNEISAGNLDYRIQYKGRDEFAPVCDDFNDMAEHLQQLILRQQRDETSRKELLAGISHDLRTPLTSIKAYVEGLLDGVAEDAPARLRYLTTIRTKAEDIDHIVDKLFLFSKLEIGEFPFYHERIDLGEELSAMADSVNADYAGKNLRMELAGGAEGIYIYADPVQLRNALLNVVENSAKYGRRDDVVVSVTWVDGDRNVAVLLTDNGPGVPEEAVEQIFDVFYRSDPSRQNPSKGSGLGLAITARIMERMGGSIRAENAGGGGLRMILELPKYAGEERE